MLIHVVRSGESIHKIAQQYGVTPQEAENANGLPDPNRLVVGEAIVVPGKGQSYVIQAGDSLYVIAQRYGVTLDALRRANPQISNPNQISVGQAIQIPDGARRDITVNGYCYPTANADTLAAALRHLTFLSVFSAIAHADGGLTPMNNDSRVIAQAKAAGVQPHLVIANIEEGKGFLSSVAAGILSNAQAQENLLQNAVAICREKGYTGVDIDFEYVPAAQREDLDCFLAKARAVLHDAGLRLTSAVAAKTRDDQTGLLTEGIDYLGQGRYNDFVTLMTYDWGHIGGPPMAVAPINEVRKVIDYALTRIPSKKILMGIPNYGYDWTLPYAQGATAKAVNFSSAINLAVQYNAAIQFSETAQTPYFNYTDSNARQHVVWFEDARSIRQKLQLVREKGLAGVSYWTVNYLFQQNWALLENMFRVVKYV
ncbi:MAG: LysM peptidoglycan-binding domain-containing protein [Oscillospiraceae bacterium]|jgi:spore germination protein|nr:LysM peptidoglycan-binding domain-containing protein [Oscillospiraceae bacterium]